MDLDKYQILKIGFLHTLIQAFAFLIFNGLESVIIILAASQWPGSLMFILWFTLNFILIGFLFRVITRPLKTKSKLQEYSMIFFVIPFFAGISTFIFLFFIDFFYSNIWARNIGYADLDFITETSLTTIVLVLLGECIIFFEKRYISTSSKSVG